MWYKISRFRIYMQVLFYSPCETSTFPRLLKFFCHVVYNHFSDVLLEFKKVLVFYDGKWCRACKNLKGELSGFRLFKAFSKNILVFCSFLSYPAPYSINLDRDIPYLLERAPMLEGVPPSNISCMRENGVYLV